MTWDETIYFIQDKPEFSELIKQAYLDVNLPSNVESFMKSDEFSETLRIIKEYYSKDNNITLADLGAGNGMASCAFTLKGYKVTSIEPDDSNIAGTGAIQSLSKHYNLRNLDIVKSYGEEIPLAENTFDIVYARQTLHHAYNLPSLMNEVSRILKPGGLFISLRDHVVYNDTDKEWFLKSHPLQEFYGGENAYTYEQYKNAISSSGLRIMRTYKHYDNVVNYAPLSPQMLIEIKHQKINTINNHLKTKLGFIGQLQIIHFLYLRYFLIYKGPLLDESKIPGRLITFIAKKTQ